MTGTEKQIKWAQEIKSEFMRISGCYIQQLEARIEKKTQEGKKHDNLSRKLDSAIKTREYFSANENASFWIENRGCFYEEVYSSGDNEYYIGGMIALYPISKI